MTLHENPYTFLSHSFLSKTRNVPDKIIEEIKTHFMYNIFFFSKNRAVYDITWKNIIELDRPQMTIWRMRIICWTPKATNTHSEYVVLIAFP